MEKYFFSIPAGCRIPNRRDGMSFLTIATPFINIGIPVFPLVPETARYLSPVSSG